MKNEDKTKSKRDQKKQKAIDKIGRSKDKLWKNATDIYHSLTDIVIIQKEEVTEQLLAKIKEAIEKVEKKKK